MARRVKEFIDIAEFNSLDELIGKLVEVRGSLPQESEPELKLRGDDVFGRRLTITYLRELTQEEAECKARYTGSVIEDTDPNLEVVRAKLDKVPFDRAAEAKRRAA